MRVEVPIDFIRMTLGMVFPPRVMRDDIQGWLDANASAGWRLEGPHNRVERIERHSWALVFVSAEEAEAFRVAWL